jgi:hypothetical protein
MESDTKNTPMTDEPRARRDAARDLASVLHIRTTDVEPFTGLRYLSKLFKVMAVILVTQGSAAIPMLLNEVSRLLVFTGLLWGAGDLAILLIDVGHDVRAARIMMSRLAPQPGEAAEEEVIISRPGERAHDIPRVTESPARPMRPADPHANPE